MSFSPSNSGSSSSESESDNDFETEEHTVHQAVDFLPYDEELEPLATEEEADEYETTIQQQQELERHYQQRYTREVAANTWYSRYILLFNRLCIHTLYCWRHILVKWTKLVDSKRWVFYLLYTSCAY